jgi:hypothetical protein
MQVYCVVFVDDEYGHHDLIAVFSTREKADKHIEFLCSQGGEMMVGPIAQFDNFTHNSGLTVDVLEVDEE